MCNVDIFISWEALVHAKLIMSEMLVNFTNLRFNSEYKISVEQLLYQCRL